MADSKDLIDFDSDPRTSCKYGMNCYRTNKSHLEKFKHPQKTSEHEPERPLKKHKPMTGSPSSDVSTTSLNQMDDSCKKFKAEETQVNSKSPKKNKLNGLSQKTSSSGKQPDSGGQTSKFKSSNERVVQKDKIRSSESKKLDLKSDYKDIIKQLFLVNMPDDFYSFWEMCETLNAADPTSALKEIKLKLVGPFDILAGKVSEVYEEDLPDFLRHWRYYYDPPEFQTVLAGMDSRCFHMGYYRDEPDEMPVFVASNQLNTKHPEKNGELNVMAQNLFAALNIYLEELKTDPFSRMKAPKFQKTLTKWANEKGFSLQKISKKMEERNGKVVAKTFHGAGIVVPVDKKNDLGYRELAASNATIKKILKGIVESKSEEEIKTFREQLQPVITFAHIANDECDFGTSLELGLDLFTYGSPRLHGSTLQLLTTAYNLLERPQFASIIQAHLGDRREGNRLSFL